MRQEELQELQSKISDASAFIRPLRTEIGRIVAGQEYLIDRVLLSLIANGHLLLEGVPGLAKTLLVKTVAQAMDGVFSRIQFTPDLLPSDVVGTTIYNQNDSPKSSHPRPLPQSPKDCSIHLCLRAIFLKCASVNPQVLNHSVGDIRMKSYLVYYRYR